MASRGTRKVSSSLNTSSLTKLCFHLTKKIVKVGTHRMDGAIAALTPLGFSKKLIRDTIRELIKVYGDNDAGWYFVEENYYKLVIDKIIEEQCQEKEGHDALEDKEKAKTFLEGTETCGQAFLQIADSSTNTGISNKLNAVHEKSPLRLEGRSDMVPYVEPSQASPPPPPPPPPPPTIRRPCYGWISEDEEE